MRKGYIIAFLLTVSLFSTLRYVQVAGEKRQLLKNIYQISDKFSSLENDRKALTQELSLINSKLIAEEIKNKQLKLTMVALKEEKQKLNQELKEEREKFDQEIKILRSKKLSLETRWGSLKELKKAIREIKKKMYSVKRKMQKSIDIVAASGGNRGYLVRDGESTFKKTTVKIKVIPVEVGN